MHNFGDLAAAKVTPDSADRLIEGNGPVPVELAGADFEFVKQARDREAGSRDAKANDLKFTLAKREKNGEQPVCRQKLIPALCARVHTC